MPIGPPPPPGYSIQFNPDGSVVYTNHPYQEENEPLHLTVTCKNGQIIQINPQTGQIYT